MKETVAVDLILFNKERLIGDAEMMTTWGENDLLIMQHPGRGAQHNQICVLNFRN